MKRAPRFTQWELANPERPVHVTTDKGTITVQLDRETGRVQTTYTTRRRRRMSYRRIPPEVKELANAFLQTCGANPNNVLETPPPRIDWDRRTLTTTELDYNEDGKWYNPTTEEALTKQVEYPIPNNVKRGHE